jgi:hypothetical protein
MVRVRDGARELRWSPRKCYDARYEPLADNLFVRIVSSPPEK